MKFIESHPMTNEQQDRTPEQRDVPPTAEHPNAPREPHPENVQAPPTHGGGPKTEAGKEKSRANSTTHGLSGDGTVRSPDDDATIMRKFRDICRDRKPTTALQCLIIWRIAVALTFLTKAENQLLTCYRNAAWWAIYDWDAWRRILLAVLLETLSSKPQSISAKLEMSPQGCRALWAEWDALDGYLEQNGCWTQEQRSWAMDLLGLSKIRRDSGRTELDPRPGDGTTALSRAQDVVRREMTRLKQRADSPELQEADQSERAQVVEHKLRPETQEARLAERYRGEHARRVEWYWKVLHKLQRPAADPFDRLLPREGRMPRQEDVMAEAMKLLQDAGLWKAGQEPPKGMKPTAKEMAHAEELFAEQQQEQAQAAAQPAPAAGTSPSSNTNGKTVGSDGASPSQATPPSPVASSSSPLHRDQRRTLDPRERTVANTQQHGYARR
jgi:hypothetical protein